ncbi:RidA family protein [Bradyrhizobium sp. Arg314]
MLQTPEQSISSPNLALFKPSGNLLGFKDRGLAYVSGERPLEDGAVKYTGRVSDAVSQESAYEAAKLPALNVMSQSSVATEGKLSTVSELVKVSGFVACTPEFTNIPAVVNGAVDLFVEVFGERGPHARFAIGVAALQRGVLVEVIARLQD